MRKRVSSIILSLLIVMLVFSACTSTGSNNDTYNNSTATQNQSEDAKRILRIDTNRVGNTNYNMVNGGFVDIENDWVYYSIKTELFKCKTDGTEKTKLFEDENGIYSLNVVDDYIYFRSLGLYRIKTDGTGYEQIAAEDSRGGVHFVDGKIYYGGEYRYNFDGTDKEQIYNKNVASGYTLNIVDGYIYFYDREAYTEDEKIYRMKYDGSELTAVYDGRTDHMIVDGEWIYYQDYSSKNLYKMKTNGTEQQAVLEASISGIIVYNGWIYYVSEGDIYKVKIDGAENQLLVNVDDVGVPSIQLFNDYLYYLINDKLYVVKTDSTENGVFAEAGEITESNEQSNNNLNHGDEDKEVVLDHSFTTKYKEKNKVSYPDFTISYPNNWMITTQDVTSSNETFILKNERGVEITFSHIGGVSEGGLGGGSGTMMSRVEVTKAADSDFVPGFVQGTDHSDLGTFVVARIKQTGLLDMKQDTDYRDVDGDVNYAVIPESRLGTDDSVNQAYSGYFAFWYTDYISLIASAPDGQFTSQEEKEVIAILSSFYVGK